MCFYMCWTRFSCKMYKLVLALPRDSKSQKTLLLFLCAFAKIDENRCTIVQNRSKSMNIVVLSFKIVLFCENRRKSLYYCSKLFKSDENHCTVVQNRVCFCENQCKSLYCRSKSFKIDEYHCTIIIFRRKSMKIVVLSFKIVQNR